MDAASPNLGPVYTSDGPLLVPTARAAGPWFPDAQHGGAVAAIVVRAIERLPSAQPMQLARLSLDLSRKVPMAPVLVDAEVVRDGLRLQSVAVTIVHGGEPVGRATALRLRERAGVVPGEVLCEPWPEDGRPPGPETAEPWDIAGGDDFHGSFDARRIGDPGVHATVWLRLLPALVDEEPVSPVQHLAAAADFITNPASQLGPGYVTANADLTIHVQRLPEGSWMYVSSRARFDGRGIGQSQGVVSDRRGMCAVALKSVLIDRR